MSDKTEAQGESKFRSIVRKISQFAIEQGFDLPFEALMNDFTLELWSKYEANELIIHKDSDLVSIEIVQENPTSGGGLDGEPEHGRSYVIRIIYNNPNDIVRTLELVAYQDKNPDMYKHLKGLAEAAKPS